MGTAFKRADILIPKCIKDMQKWSVIACDQYTSQPDYWEQTKLITDGYYSTYNLILPEIYLNDTDVSEKIDNIHKAMDEYITKDIFKEYKNTMIYVERIQSNGIMRAGIIGMIDLEEYDFTKGSTSSVRATEATVIERIPPRIKVRQGAALEIPHIMILIDDIKLLLNLYMKKNQILKSFMILNLCRAAVKLLVILWMTNHVIQQKLHLKA